MVDVSRSATTAARNGDRIRGLPWWTTGAFTLQAEDDDEQVTLDATTVDRFSGDVLRGRGLSYVKY